MRGSGVWGSKHQGKIPIPEMNDGHLINAIVYWRRLMLDHYRESHNRTGERMEQMLGTFEDLVTEAAMRHLQWDYSEEPANPDDFKGQAYERRQVKTPIQPPRGGKSRVSRSVGL